MSGFLFSCHSTEAKLKKNMEIKKIEFQEILEQLKNRHYPMQKSYLAMYSSWYQGIITDPSLMLVPIDDHQFHRGDGVFEAMKYINGHCYLFDAHIDRLIDSASRIGIKLPCLRSEFKKIILATAEAAERSELMLRIFLSRGPGGFTTNPYESLGSQLYVVATEFKPYPEQKYLDGVKIVRSFVPTKEAWLATIKSCNYLPNVMMKKEAVDRGVDFTINLDPQGYIAEGSTENIVILNNKNELCRPHFDYILKGTTMMRAFHLAESLKEKSLIQSIRAAQMTIDDLLQAKEVMMIGTTLDVLSVTQFEDQMIGDGKVGAISQALRNLILEDQKK